jgi:hypothetical protein
MFPKGYLGVHGKLIHESNLNSCQTLFNNMAAVVNFNQGAKEGGLYRCNIFNLHVQLSST